MSFGVTPVSGTVPATSQTFPDFIQFQANGVALGAADADTVDFAGVGASRGTGESSNKVTINLREIPFGEGAVNVSSYGDLSTSGEAATAFAAATADVSNSGLVINPKGSALDLSTATIPNGVIVFDVASQQIITSNVAVGKSVQAGGGHLLVRDARENQGTRMHVEPRGYVAGTASKLDMMFDPYEDDGVNYRIFNFYVSNYDPTNASTTQGNNGIGVVGLKATGNPFGVWPAMHFGFSDDGPSAAVPLKLYYFDTSDTVWRTPLLGAWRTGAAVTTGDYMLASNKLYQAASTATTGATKPSHAAGTVSDGAVDWTFVRDFAATANNIKGCVVIGDRDELPKFGNPTQRLQIAKQVGVWNGIKLQFMDNVAAVAWNIYSAANTDDLYIESADGNARLRMDATGKFTQTVGLARCTAAVSVSDNSATPTVTLCEKVLFSNSATTAITQILGQPPHATLVVGSGNNNTTLVHNATPGTSLAPTIALNTGANKLLSDTSVVVLRLNSSQTQWVEDGRYAPADLTISNLSTTPSVAGAETVTFSNASPVSVTQMLGGTVRNRLTVMATNGNTTLVHNGTAGSAGAPTIATATNANKVLTAGSCLEFRLNGAGTQWIEVGRL